MSTPRISDPCRHCPLDFFEEMDRVSRWREKQTEPVWFSVTARLGSTFPADLPALMEKWTGRGLKMILWQNPEERAQMPGSLLWQTAKAGIWNHFSAPDLLENGSDTDLARFVLHHPHVVHSFDLPAGRTLTGITHAYDKIDPLPGTAFWQTLAGPDEILSYLGRYPADQLVRMRWNQGNRMVLGDEMAFSFQSPADLTPGYLEQIHAMVLAGGSVNARHVRSNLENAYLIGLAMENKIIVGCSCLKHPRAALIQRLKTATGMDFSGCVERGYTSVRPEYRSLGVGRRLLEGLTARAGQYKVFAIIDETNLVTQKIARWNRTRKIATYFSEQTGKQMGIWMPAHMPPPNQQIENGPEPSHKADIQ